MGTETNTLENAHTEPQIDLETQTKVKKAGKAVAEENRVVQFGVRFLMTNPLCACEKLDRIFGSGSEAIVHQMWFESGQSLFDNMIKCNPSKSKEELLRALVDVQPRTGWGNVSLNIVHRNPPIVDVMVKNPPVKTVNGSRKYLIGSFWVGVLSRYFNRQLMCKNFSYDAERDEFSCTVTI